MNNIIILMLLLVLTFMAGIAHGYTREEVAKRGVLHCGVSTGSPGFSSVDTDGRWTGLDVDMCRGVAAATLGDANKVEFLPLAENEAFTALIGGEVDILSRHSTWTYTRDTALTTHFTGVSYYDGQGGLVATSLGAKNFADLKKVKVCNPSGLSSSQNLIDYLERHKIDYKLVSYDNVDLAVKGFEGGACDLISMQLSQLYGVRLGLKKPEESIVLPDVISKQPLGPVVRQGDDVWFNIVRWTVFAMINGEELGITSDNVDEMKISNKLDVKRFFGLEGSGGQGMGLKKNWASEIIRQVGNYGEIFERSLGAKSAMKVERGMNNLWNNGGLMYAPPLR